MEKVFIASLVRNGVLGGTLTLTDDAVVYRTGKLTVPQEYRNLRIGYHDIASCEKSVTSSTFTLKSGDSYTFIVFGNEKLARLVGERGVLVRRRAKN